MPIHDWTKVIPGIFHDFHHEWIADLSRALNGGLLPEDYYALPEQVAGGFGPDVLALNRPGDPGGPHATGGTATLTSAPPRVRFRLQAEANRYAAKAKAVAVRHASGHRVVALIEIVSPGNKNSRHGLDAFARKAREALAAWVHLLIVDLFPPGPRDPAGIHSVVWGDDDDGEAFRLPDGEPLTCASYIGGAGAAAFVEPAAVGDALPDMPLFLDAETYVPVPLEATYLSAWEAMPAYWRDRLAAHNGGPTA